MKFGLKDEVVQRINNVFEYFPEIDAAILYGSRAKGNFKPASDIDLTLKGDRLNLTIINKIRLMLNDLLLPFTFDISIYKSLKNKDLVEHIDRVGIVFYSKAVVST